MKQFRHWDKWPQNVARCSFMTIVQDCGVGSLPSSLSLWLAPVSLYGAKEKRAEHKKVRIHPWKERRRYRANQSKNFVVIYRRHVLYITVWKKRNHEDTDILIVFGEAYPRAGDCQQVDFIEQFFKRWNNTAMYLHIILNPFWFKISKSPIILSSRPWIATRCMTLSMKYTKRKHCN